MYECDAKCFIKHSFSIDSTALVVQGYIMILAVYTAGGCLSLPKHKKRHIKPAIYSPIQ